MRMCRQDRQRSVGRTTVHNDVFDAVVPQRFDRGQTGLQKSLGVESRRDDRNRRAVWLQDIKEPAGVGSTANGSPHSHPHPLQI